MLTTKSSRLNRAKKGFTLTELAIVIAVIAILIAVLVPTFTSIITNARKSNATTAANYVVTEYFGEFLENPQDGSIIYDEDFGDYYVVYDSTTDDVYTAYSTDEDDFESYVKGTYLVFTGDNGSVYYYGTDSDYASAATLVAHLYASSQSALAVLAGEAYEAAASTNICVAFNGTIACTVIKTPASSTTYNYFVCITASDTSSGTSAKFAKLTEGTANTTYTYTSNNTTYTFTVSSLTTVAVAGCEVASVTPTTSS